MALLLGIDLGTSYFKVGLFDESGVVKGLGRVAVGPSQPLEGRVELAANEFWQRLRLALDEALTMSGATARDIAGISYSSQANTVILLDADRRALTPLIFWQDRRAHPLDEALLAFGATERHARTTGLSGIVPERAPAKWRWLAQQLPQLWARTAHALTISDYFTYALTGERCGDASTAALTGLYDLTTGTWWNEALEIFGISPVLLAKPLPSGARCGPTSAVAFEHLGVPTGIPFAVGALDHHAAAIGSGLGAFADASLSTGTVLAAFVLVDRVTPARGCIHGPHTQVGQYFRLTFEPDGAGRMEKYQRDHAPHLEVADLIRLAENLPRAAPASGEQRHGAAVRHMLEEMVAAQQSLLSQAADGTRVRTVTATGGGARSPFLLQMQSDALGLPVVTAECAERACLGAASFAAVVAGLFPDARQAAAAMVRRSRTYLPRRSNAVRASDESIA